MRKPLGILVCLLLLLSPAAADDKPKQPAKPLTTEQAADAVLAAVKAQDDDALKSLAEKDEPDPWLVADELCYRGEYDAAEAFAKAAPRVDVEKLPAYVGVWRKRKPDPAERELMAAMNAALGARQPQTAIDATETLELPVDTLTRVRLRHARGVALRLLARLPESADVLHRAADAALALGWLRRASRLYDEAAGSAYLAGAWSHALAYGEKHHALAMRRGDSGGAAGALRGIGDAQYELADYQRALTTYEQALTETRAVGDKHSAARTLTNLGNIHMRLGDYRLALATYEQALAELKALGDKHGAANTLGNIGNVHSELGDYQKALATHEQALAEQVALGDRRSAAIGLGNIGIAHQRLGDSQKALAAYEQAIVELKALGDRSGAARTLGNIAVVHSALGDYQKALATHEQALAEKKALGKRHSAAWTLGSIGAVHHRLGDYAKALKTYERALAEFKALGDKHGAANTLGNIGIVHSDLGNYQKALATHEQALAEKKAVGDKSGAANTLANIGNVHYRIGDYAKALASYEQALAEEKALGDRRGAVDTLGNIGVLHSKRGDYQKALATYEQALTEKEALGDRHGVALTLGNIGVVHYKLDNYAKALASLKRSARASRSLRATPLFVTAQRNLAQLYLMTGKPARALAAAQLGVDALEDVLGGLGEEQGATAREQHDSLFGIGTLAAVREESAADAVSFLEGGRAGALLDALDKREALRWKATSLPPELRRLDLEAQAKESAARHAYDLAAKRGNLKETRAASEALDKATEAVRDVAGRIQRDLKHQAGLFYPRAKTTEEIEASLEADQALVLYGLCLDEALALVLRRDGARIVSLGRAADVTAACEALDATSPDEDVRPALASLRNLIVEPLKLGKDVKQVLISPEGPLCYLPFGALFAQTVAMTPSGTTHALLRGAEREPGQGILALGEPDYAGASKAAQEIYYRGRPLSPLPATRKEVEAIGTNTLLGAKASEGGLKEALPMSKRWRAVHFACHGLVDIDRPMLSSLALSRAGDDDGFLTALELLRTKIPADLVVLSACETATGKIVKGEGIVGLTRAFMFAGAPRVICSLWKVDDEATQVLMIKFYELWNPKDGRKGLPAATALKGAQEYVREFKDKVGKQKWKHPYYWAAWVLWGLPE